MNVKKLLNISDIVRTTKKSNNKIIVRFDEVKLFSTRQEATLEQIQSTSMEVRVPATAIFF